VDDASSATAESGGTTAWTTKAVEIAKPAAHVPEKCEPVFRNGHAQEE
jgi:hypothetical protein